VLRKFNLLWSCDDGRILILLLSQGKHNISSTHLKISKIRRIAENQMLEFVSSLKYYSKIWPRANIFSRICNLLGTSVLPGSVDSSKLNQYDIHTQTFFLWMYSELHKNEEDMTELPEGQTLVLKPIAISLFLDHFSFFLNNNES